MKKTLLAWIFILTVTNSTAQQQPVKYDISKPSTPLTMLLQITKDVNLCDVLQK